MYPGACPRTAWTPGTPAQLRHGLHHRATQLLRARRSHVNLDRIHHSHELARASRDLLAGLRGGGGRCRRRSASSAAGSAAPAASPSASSAMCPAMACAASAASAIALAYRLPSCLILFSSASCLCTRAQSASNARRGACAPSLPTYALCFPRRFGLELVERAGLHGEGVGVRSAGTSPVAGSGGACRRSLTAVPTSGRTGSSACFTQHPGSRPILRLGFVLELLQQQLTPSARRAFFADRFFAFSASAPTCAPILPNRPCFGVGGRTPRHRRLARGTSASARLGTPGRGVDDEVPGRRGGGRRGRHRGGHRGRAAAGRSARALLRHLAPAGGFGRRRIRGRGGGIVEVRLVAGAVAGRPHGRREVRRTGCVMGSARGGGPARERARRGGGVRCQHVGRMGFFLVQESVTSATEMSKPTRGFGRGRRGSGHRRTCAFGHCDCHARRRARVRCRSGSGRRGARLVSSERLN